MNAEPICLDFSRKKRVSEKVKPLSSKKVQSHSIGVLLMKNGIWDLLLNLAMRRAFLTWFLEFKTSITTPVKSTFNLRQTAHQIQVEIFHINFSITPRCLLIIKEHQKESNECRWIKINRKWRRLKSLTGKFPCVDLSIWSVIFFGI